MRSITDEVFELFARNGEDAYFGEAVSQLEHALQAAQLANEEGATDSLVVAALLHDVGHLVEGTAENIADFGIDAKHEEIGRRWLAARFGNDVVEPVYLHVSAKRYLCATDSSYFETLSAASVKSLELQGGTMSGDEVAEFESNEFYVEAVALRRWDDRAKIPGLETPPLSFYKNVIQAAESPAK